VAVHQVHFYGENGLPHVRTAAIDDEVVVGVLSGFTSGAGPEEDDFQNTGAESFAHQPREFDSHGVGPVHRFHTGMLARSTDWPEIRGFAGGGPAGPEIADPSAPVTTEAPQDDRCRLRTTSEDDGLVRDAGGAPRRG
jgi:hypothetical protein